MKIYVSPMLPCDHLLITESAGGGRRGWGCVSFEFSILGDHPHLNFCRRSKTGEANKEKKEMSWKVATSRKVTTLSIGSKQIGQKNIVFWVESKISFAQKSKEVVTMVPWLFKSIWEYSWQYLQEIVQYIHCNITMITWLLPNLSNIFDIIK